MNILITTFGLPRDHEYSDLIAALRNRHHIVETVPSERIYGYLRWEMASRLAAVDVIVCYAEAPMAVVTNDPVLKALNLAEDVQRLPDQCAMHNGRKWRSLPFVIICEGPYFLSAQQALSQTHARILRPSPDYPAVLIGQIKDIVDAYMTRILNDYESMGIMVRFDRGHAQISPALLKKQESVESNYYYSPADRRKARQWLTVMRDSQGLQVDVEMFQQLLDRNSSETEMQHFFDEHPLFLMQARLGIPVPHPRFKVPTDYVGDFALTPILGPIDQNRIEMLELKGPPERLLNSDRRHRGFSGKVHKAVDQVRDYVRYMKNPANREMMIEQFGYLPSQASLAVLIGRDPKDEIGKEEARLRQSELDVKVITYDKILETQARQLSPIITPDITDVMSLKFRGTLSTDFLR